MSAQLRRIAVLKFYVSWLVSLTLLTLLRRPMGWAPASWLQAITRASNHAIIAAMGTLLYSRPITTIPDSLTCHPRAPSASRS
jgi:hypothetical protein